MRSLVVLSLAALLTGEAMGGERGQSPVANRLSQQEIAAGWLLCFDGESSFGWTGETEILKERKNAELKIDDGVLILGSLKTKGVERALAPLCFDNFEMKVEYRVQTRGEVSASLQVFRGDVQALNYDFGRTDNTLDKWGELHVEVSYDPKQKVHRIKDLGSKPSPNFVWAKAVDAQGPLSLRLATGLGTRLLIRSCKIRPLETKSLFNGKDLTGWREFPAKKSKFTVTDKGELNVKDGPGDLQTEGQYGDFVLQLECISHGKHLNSGVFFRCRPGEYQQGYEAQIRNQFTTEVSQEYTIEEFDVATNKLSAKRKVKSPAVDYGTGGIYRRMPARKEMSKDGEWFAMTVVAQGRRLATWVNGVQVADWIDHRPLANNARNGCRLEPGPISLQGHDPTTNLSFRNLRIAEISAGKKSH